MNRKNSIELIYNYVSMGVMAVGGLLFSIIIGITYNADVLGVFNTVYAYYIVLSQLCVCGIHMAMTRYCSQYGETEKSNELLSVALLMTFVISVFVVLIVFFLTNFVLSFLFSEHILQAFNMIWVALPFFAMNKVFLGYLNGILKMKVYAIFQGSRNLFIALSILLFSITRTNGYRITLSFFVAEIVLFCMGVGYYLFHNGFNISFNQQYIKVLWHFGIRIVPANMVLELNTKADVLCMSFLIQDERIIGIYSFATLFAEGFYQLIVVVRRMINPYLTQWFNSKELENRLVQLKKKFWKQVVGVLIVVLGLISVIYYLLSIFLNDNGYIDGLIPMLVICVFIILNFKSVFLGNILSQTGFPFEESIVNISTVSSNILLNLCFIRLWGMTGAALATGISYCIFAFMQRIFIKKKLVL